MKNKEEEGKKEKRILILCVDRDNDLGKKAEVTTPLLGRTKNLNAAVNLALADPEEPDANAMFEAVRLIDGLSKEKKPEETFEVATIAGSEMGGVGADRKLVSELNSILDSFSADEVILVTDGYSDEAVLPLVESRVYVSSVRRIIVKHSESIEETAALFSRYLRIIAENPRYSRIALGIPGLLFVLLGVLAYFELVQYYLIAIIVCIGGIMLIKGFGIDKTAKNFYRWVKEYSPPPLPIQIQNFATIAGILAIVVGIYSGVTNVSNNLVPLPPDWGVLLGNLATIVGYFILGAQDLIVVGICTILIGRTIRLYFERDAKVLRSAALVIMVAWSRWILDGAAEVLISSGTAYEQLVVSIVVGILIGIASVLVIIIINRSTRGFFKKPDEKTDELDKE